MKLDMPVKKQIQKDHCNHEKPFARTNTLCNHEKQGWKSLQNIIYSDLCPYSVIQPHKLKRVFDQSTSQTPAFPANYSVISLDLGILFFMSNLKKNPQHNSVCYILSCPNWTRRGVCSLALHSNLLFLQAVSTQSSLASVTQLSLFKFFSHKSCFPELWSLPSVSLLNCLQQSFFCILYTFFLHTFHYQILFFAVGSRCRLLSQRASSTMAGRSSS